MIRRELRWLLAGLLVIFVAGAFAKDDPKNAGKNQSASLSKAEALTLTHTVLNINDFMVWMRRDGQINHTPSQNAGGFYPRGTTTAIYQDNVVWGGVAYIDNFVTKAASPHGVDAPGVRIGGGTYNQGTQAGTISGTGATATAMLQTDPLIRIWRVRRDFKAMATQEVTNDAADLNRVPGESVTATMRTEVTDRYQFDWDNWPVALGAPYIERNGTPGYQAPPAFSSTFTAESLITQKRDEPGVAGIDPNSPADQVVWSVSNDLSASLVTGFQGSYPIGLEVQRTVWGYKGSSEIGSIYFTRYKIINKGGGATTSSSVKGQLWLDSMFVCQWSDPDVGDSGDDLAGCDTTLSVGYAYNGQGKDLEYTKFKLAPPAVGYDFLAGPVYPAPGDSAVFDLKRVYNKKNRGMSSFAYFSAGSDISDPAFDAEGGQQWWRMLRGYVPDPTGQALRYYPFPPGITQNQFPLSGDPTTGSGFLDGQGTTASLGLGDRRVLLNTGPFQMAPQDTQEIYVGTVAGLGADRFSSITKMKLNDRAVQNTFDALFKVPKNPDRPNVKYSELDGNVAFEWGSDTALVQRTEAAISQPGNFQFEGYRVYQLPSSGARLSDGRVVFSADLVNIYGDNTKIARYFKFDQDYLRDVPKLNNGQQYYIAVTAYAVSHIPGYVPSQIESSPVVYTVIPQLPGNGNRLAAKVETLIPVTRTAGIANGPISVKVVNPLQLTGDTYEIQIAAFDSVTVTLAAPVKAGNHVFRLFNVTQNKVVFNYRNTYGISDINPIFDGFQFGFNVSPYYVAGTEIGEIVAPSNFKEVAAGLAFFNGGIDVGANFRGSSIDPWDVTKSVEIRFNSAVGQKAYVWKRTAAGTGAAKFAGLFDQPFTVWDISNPAAERQIDFMFLEAVGSAYDNNVWGPGAGSGDREYFYIMDKTYTGSDNFSLVVNTTTEGSFMPTSPTLYAGWLVKGNVALNAYDNGDIFRIVASVPTTSASRWRFSTADYKLQFDAANAKTDVNNINVWPNPYYAFNPSETNRFNRFVTFNNLPAKATIRIFNMAGQQVRVLDKDDPGQFIRWDLTNTNNFPVASGMYIAYIDMPDVGGSSATKILKLGVIQEQEILDVY